MSTTDRIDPGKRNTDVYNAYIEAAQQAVLLRSIVIDRAPGNKKITFTQFRKAFNMLYILTFGIREFREMNQPLIEDVKKWISHANRKDITSILFGIELYERYVNSLMDGGQIQYV